MLLQQKEVSLDSVVITPKEQEGLILGALAAVALRMQMGGATVVMGVGMARLFGYDLGFVAEDGQVDYRLVDGHWHLAYYRSNLGFWLKAPESKGGTGEKIHHQGLQELVITGFLPELGPIPPEEQINPNKVLGTQLGEYDEAFWEQYTYLTPTSSLKEIAKQMK